MPRRSMGLMATGALLPIAGPPCLRAGPCVESGSGVIVQRGSSGCGDLVDEDPPGTEIFDGSSQR